jgi:hypothetical protein
VAPNDVWVVDVDNYTGQSVAVHWNRHRWTQTPTPAFTDSAVLFDVVARSRRDVWAVGWCRDTDKHRPRGAGHALDRHRLDRGTAAHRHGGGAKRTRTGLPGV